MCSTRGHFLEKQLTWLNQWIAIIRQCSALTPFKWQLARATPMKCWHNTTRPYESITLRLFIYISCIIRPNLDDFTEREYLCTCVSLNAVSTVQHQEHMQLGTVINIVISTKKQQYGTLHPRTYCSTKDDIRLQWSSSRLLDCCSEKPVFESWCQPST